MAEVGEHYRRVRLRLTDLLRGIGDDDWSVPVPACPGWTVHDVLSHVVGIVEDVNAGLITGPPDESQTAAQVERHRHDGPADMLDRWTDLGEPFEQLVTAVQAWPAALDVLSHEHDIRAALDRPGARDDELVLTAARQMIEFIDVEGTLTVDLGDQTVCSARKPGPDYRLRATRSRSSGSAWAAGAATRSPGSTGPATPRACSTTSSSSALRRTPCPNRPVSRRWGRRRRR